MRRALSLSILLSAILFAGTIIWIGVSPYVTLPELPEWFTANFWWGVALLVGGEAVRRYTRLVWAGGGSIILGVVVLLPWAAGFLPAEETPGPAWLKDLMEALGLQSVTAKVLVGIVLLGGAYCVFQALRSGAKVWSRRIGHIIIGTIAVASLVIMLLGEDLAARLGRHHVDGVRERAERSINGSPPAATPAGGRITEFRPGPGESVDLTAADDPRVVVWVGDWPVRVRVLVPDQSRLALDRNVIFCLERGMLPPDRTITVERGVPLGVARPGSPESGGGVNFHVHPPHSAIGTTTLPDLYIQAENRGNARVLMFFNWSPTLGTGPPRHVRARPSSFVSEQEGRIVYRTFFE